MKIAPQTLKVFADFISAELGIVYEEANFYQLETRIIELIQDLHLPDAEALQADLKTNSQTRSLLLDHATNNETSFFRDQGMFVALEKVISDDGFALRQSPLRIWSAACSYGQEIYSLTIMLEGIRSKLPTGGYEILGTDISDRALKHASDGIYTDLQVHRGLNPLLLQDYFRQLSADKWQIRDELKRHLQFKKVNLLDSFEPLGMFDLILCRNVLIYQSTASKKAIIKRLHDRLNAKGILILGAAESLIGLSEDFDMLRFEKATLYRKRSH